MTYYRQADIVLVPFPFTDLSTTKKRPALVVSSNWINNSQDCILVAITGTIFPTLLRDEILVTGQEAHQAGLVKESVVKASKIFTIEQRLIDKQLGKLSLSTFNKVIETIATVIGSTN